MDQHLKMAVRNQVKMLYTSTKKLISSVLFGSIRSLQMLRNSPSSSSTPTSLLLPISCLNCTQSKWPIILCNHSPMCSKIYLNEIYLFSELKVSAGVTGNNWKETSHQATYPTKNFNINQLSFRFIND